jgi:Tfp pilus assembly protein PilF
VFNPSGLQFVWHRLRFWTTIQKPLGSMIEMVQVHLRVGQVGLAQHELDQAQNLLLPFHQLFEPFGTPENRKAQDPLLWRTLQRHQEKLTLLQGWIWLEEGNGHSARDAFLWVLSQREKEFGPLAPQKRLPLAFLIRYFRLWGMDIEALQHVSHWMQIQSSYPEWGKTYEAELPELIAEALEGLSQLYAEPMSEGQTSANFPMLELFLQTEVELEEWFPLSAIHLRTVLAQIQEELGEEASAIVTLEACLKTCETQYGPTHPEVTHRVLWLATIAIQDQTIDIAKAGNPVVLNQLEKLLPQLARSFEPLLQENAWMDAALSLLLFQKAYSALPSLQKTCPFSKNAPPLSLNQGIERFKKQLENASTTEKQKAQDALNALELSKARRLDNQADYESAYQLYDTLYERFQHDGDTQTELSEQMMSLAEKAQQPQWLEDLLQKRLKGLELGVKNDEMALAQAALFRRTAISFLECQQPERAHALLEASQKILKDYPDEVVAHWDQLFCQATWFEHQGDLFEAFRHGRKALKLKVSIVGKQDRSLGEELFLMVTLAHRLNRPRQVQHYGKWALGLYTDELMDEDPLVAQESFQYLIPLLSYLATYHESQEEHDEASALIQQLMSLEAAVLGMEHPEVAKSMRWLARQQHLLGNHEEAIGLLMECRRCFEQVLHQEKAQEKQSGSLTHSSNARTPRNENVPEALQEMTRCEYILSVLYYELKNWPEAIHWAYQTLENDLFLYPETNEAVRKDYVWLITLNELAHQWRECEALLEKLLKAEAQVYGTQDMEYIKTFRWKGLIAQQQGDLPRASKIFEESLAMMLPVVGEHHEEVARTYQWLLQICTDGRDYAQAEGHCRKALGVFATLYGIKDVKTVSMMANLATIFRELGKHSRAQEMYEKAMSKIESIMGPDHPAIAAIAFNYGMLLENLNEFQQAEAHFKKALEIDMAHLGFGHEEVANDLTVLAGFYYHRGQYQKAESYFQRGIKVREALPDKDLNQLALNHHNLATVLCEQGRFGESEVHYQKALDLKATLYGQNHSELLHSLECLAELYSLMNRFKDQELIRKRIERLEKTSNHTVRLLDNPFQPEQ